MKKFMVALLVCIMVSTVLLGGCGSSNDLEERVAALEKDESKYLITVNQPVEWGDASRIGTFYFIYQLAELLQEEGKEVHVYFGPEASEMVIVDGAENYELPEALQLLTETNNMAEWGEKITETGVTFYSTDALYYHEWTKQDYVTHINHMDFLDLVDECGTILRY